LTTSAPAISLAEHDVSRHIEIETDFQRIVGGGFDEAQRGGVMVLGPDGLPKTLPIEQRA
jgi:hypothetical protein